GVVDRAGAPDKVLELVVERLNERGIDATAIVRRTQLVERMHQRFCDEHATIRAKMALGIRKIVRIHQVSPGQGANTTFAAPPDSQPIILPERAARIEPIAFQPSTTAAMTP